MINKSEISAGLKKIGQAKDSAELEKLRLEFLGRKGKITAALRGVATLNTKQRAEAGRATNEAKQAISAALAKRLTELEQQALKADSGQLDLTAPGRGPQIGHLHPVEQIRQQLIMAFWQIGFELADGPEIETDWYNFEALNIPADHPARDMQDTFYLENGSVARTHTSSVQIRYMETHKPPIRIISPGVVYRNEDEDASHLAVFTQLEALVVDQGVSLSDLKGTILYMMQRLFGEDTKIRLRPNYFPYVEPALEADASCMLCKQNDPKCRLCKGTGWVELGGSGMVHPQVLRNVGLDPAKYSGFAFGFGIERLAAVKFQVDDVRYFWRPKLEFLEQF